MGIMKNKKPTTTNIAQLAGVSQTTVSLVLNKQDSAKISNTTQTRVLEAARQLGYQPKAKKRKKTFSRKGVIGYIFPSYANIFHVMTAQAIEEDLRLKGYGLLLCNSERDGTKELEVVEYLIDQKIKGIIFSFNPREYVALEEYSKKTPIVILGEKNEKTNINTVSLNSFHAGEVLAKHLIDLGHKNIAFITTPLTDYALSRKLRVEGLKSMFEKYYLESSFVIEECLHEFDSYRYEDEIQIGYQMTEQLLKKYPNVTAIIGLNDMFALGILSCLHSAGISVPKDISVCGFDNIYMGKYLNTSLTTVDHFLEKRCKTAVELLLESANELQQKIVKIEFDPQLIIRDSTGICNK